jgi:glycosyltransferase involved in cell wall biosynthesis
MSEQLVSVIVPVYNVERYLTQAVESVLNQTHRNLELILVDDGSTDGSGLLCDELAKRDNRVVVLRRQNGGAAAARNTGLAAAHGEWVLLLDGDDYYETNSVLERLLSAADASNAQIVCFHYRRVGEYARPARQSPGGGLICSLSDLIRENRYTSSPCLKLIRRTLLEEQTLRFEEGIFCEDVEWSLKLLLSGTSIVSVPEVLYCYRIRSGSVTQSVSIKHVCDLLHAVEQCRADSLACENKALGELGLAYTAFQYCTLLINARLSGTKPDRQILRRIFDLSGLLQHDQTRIVRLVHLTSKVLGIRATSLLLYWYFRLFAEH